MSDHIAHIAICDDTFRLAAPLPDIHPWFKRLMAEHRDEAHLGSVTRYADKWSIDMLRWAHEQLALDEAQRDRFLAPKTAFILGSLTHRAADRLTKPITHIWAGHRQSTLDIGDANESKIMQDLCVLREVFGHGAGEHAAQFPKPLFHAFEHEDGQRFEQAFRALLTRALIGMHTIRPDGENIQPWFDALFEQRQTYPKLISLYNQLDAAWDPAKVKMYLTDMHFYDREDELIKLARAAQHGTAITAGQVEDAHAATPYDQSGPSRYARALSRAIDYLRCATQIVEGRLDDEQARAAFDIGIPDMTLAQ